jgi:hypothetical protein
MQSSARLSGSWSASYRARVNHKALVRQSKLGVWLVLLFGFLGGANLDRLRTPRRPDYGIEAAFGAIYLGVAVLWTVHVSRTISRLTKPQE